MGLFVLPNYTATKTVPAVAGLHPPLKVIYRLASSKERCLYKTKAAASNVDAFELFESDLICKHLVSINGINNPTHASGPWLVTKTQISELRPSVRQIVIDLILGKTPEDPGAAEKLDVAPVEPPPVVLVNSFSGSVPPSS